MSIKWRDPNESLPDPDDEVVIVQTFGHPYITHGWVEPYRTAWGQPSTKDFYWKWVKYPADHKIKDPTSCSFICPGNEYVKGWLPKAEYYEGLHGIEASLRHGPGDDDLIRRADAVAAIIRKRDGLGPWAIDAEYYAYNKAADAVQALPAENIQGSRNRLCDLYVIDKTTNEIHRIGEGCHDSLIVYADGVRYYDMQNGDGGGPDNDPRSGYCILQTFHGAFSEDVGIWDDRFREQIKKYMEEQDGKI